MAPGGEDEFPTGSTVVLYVDGRRLSLISDHGTELLFSGTGAGLPWTDGQTIKVSLVWEGSFGRRRPASRH